MAIINMTMPKMGESIMEATILKWNKKSGGHVSTDETVLEIATDKVDSEVPSIVDGEITEILFNENDVVPVGAVIARINTSGEQAENPEDDTPLLVPDEDTAATAVRDEEPAQKEEPETKEQQANRFYSPLVLTIAR